MTARHFKEILLEIKAQKKTFLKTTVVEQRVREDVQGVKSVT